MAPRKGRPPQLGVTREHRFIFKLHASEVEMLAHLAAEKECSSAEVLRTLIRRAFEKAHRAGKMPELETPYPEG